MLCAAQPLLPVGLTDIPYEKSVKLYCGRCEDIYSPKSSRHGSIDGAYFGTTFPHLLFLVYPNLIPAKVGGTEGGAAGLGAGSSAFGSSLSKRTYSRIHPGSTSGGGAGADSRARRRARDDAEVLPAEGGGGGGEAREREVLTC